MAATTYRQRWNSTSNVTTYAATAFTPAAGDLLVCLVGITASVVDTVAYPRITTNVGLTFTRYPIRAVKASSADSMYLLVANAFCANVSHTLTFDCTGDAATSCLGVIYSVSGMLRTGTSGAVRQAAKQDNQGATTTPAPAFGANALTGNPCYGAVFNATSPAGLTPPSGWTENASADHGQSTPTCGQESAYINSGFTGTTVTWGSTSASAFCSLIAELDTSAPDPPPDLWMPPRADIALRP